MLKRRKKQISEEDQKLIDLLQSKKDYVIELLTDGIDDVVDDIIECMHPEKALPFIGYNIEKDAFYVSTTDDDEFDGYYDFGAFLFDVCEWEFDVKKEFLKRVRDLVFVLENDIMDGAATKDVVTNII